MLFTPSAIEMADTKSHVDSAKDVPYSQSFVINVGLVAVRIFPLSECSYHVRGVELIGPVT